MDVDARAAEGENKVMEWISVKGRLPEKGEQVLVTNGGFVCECYFVNNRWERGGVPLFFMTPTHWMPMPEPPKEKCHEE